MKSNKLLLIILFAAIGSLVPASAQITVQWFDASIGDKVSLYGDRLEDANMYGLGIESFTMYFRSQNRFRWYSNNVADGGASDLMELGNSTGLVVNKMITANGSRRGMLINGDDQDSCLTFHDANNGWYSMGMDYSDNRVFKINYGGSVGETEGIAMNSDGDIGFGTSNPRGRVDVRGTIQLGGRGQEMGNTPNEERGIVMYCMGTSTSELWGAHTAGRIYGSNSTYEANGTGGGWANQMLVLQAGNTWDGYVPKQLILKGNGNVGIGTTTPENALDVAGTIRAEEIIVASDWADYVFEDDYELMPLTQVQSYIANACRECPVPKRFRSRE